MLDKILEKLIEIEGALDDAYYSIPEYDCNSDGKSYVDSARCELYSLKEDIEKYAKDKKNTRKKV
tara:strand:- start:1299 stop:1493 length:195 start_codon:yes stop_codon:yes gene_type:complete